MSEDATSAPAENAPDDAVKSLCLTKSEQAKLKRFVGKNTLEAAARTCSTTPPHTASAEPLEHARRVLVAQIVLRAGKGETPAATAAAIRAAGLPATTNTVVHVLNNWTRLRGRTERIVERLDLAGSCETVTPDSGDFDAAFESPELGELMHLLLIRRTSESNFVPTVTSTTSLGAAELQLGCATQDEPPTSQAPTTLEELADSICRDRPRRRTVPKFLRYMHKNHKATFDTIASEVHEATVEDSAVKRTIIEANKEIKRARIPINLKVSDRTVYR
jgi:hypothetical protein